MPSKGSVTEWIEGVKVGDPVAAQKLWNRYVGQLIRIAHANLKGTSRGVADEEDVVLVAFDSFLRAAKRGSFPRLRDRHDLWRLLIAITARKATHQVQHLYSQKRGGGKMPEQSGRQPNRPAAGHRVMDQVVDNLPTPAFAALAAEEFRRLMRLLGDATLCRVARWKMEGYSNEEIAEQLECSSRTVERKLHAIRRKWSPEVSP